MGIGTQSNWQKGAVAVIGAGAVIALGACSSSDSGTSASPSAPTPAGTTSAPAPAPTAPAAGVPGPPPGATANGTGTGYTAYKTAQTPAAVVAYYDTAFKNAGFTVTNTGGGGGGWGEYGGSEAGLTANDGGTFAAVQAGGQKGKTTFFEVCQGASQAAVASCQSQNHEQNDNSGGS